MFWTQSPDLPLSLTIPKPPRTTSAVRQYHRGPEHWKLRPLWLYIRSRHNVGNSATASYPKREECRVDGLLLDQRVKIWLCGEDSREDPDQCSVSLMFVSILKIGNATIRGDFADIANLWSNSCDRLYYLANRLIITIQYRFRPISSPSTAVMIRRTPK